MSVASVQIAKQRLQTLLIADRMKCTPDITDRLSEDICHTLSKYMVVDPEKLSVQITRTEIHIKYTGENE